MLDALRNVEPRLRQTIVDSMHGEFGDEKISSNALLKRLDSFEQFHHYYYRHEDFARALAAAGISVTRRDRAVELPAV